MNSLQAVDTKLKNGDPAIGWRGDPRLSLQVGQIVTQKGVLIAEKLEVWRHNEDGSDTCLSWWEMHELGRVLWDLRLMDMHSPAYEPALERIDRHNSHTDAERGTEIRDRYGEIAEHFVWVFRNKYNR